MVGFVGVGVPCVAGTWSATTEVDFGEYLHLAIAECGWVAGTWEGNHSDTDTEHTSSHSYSHLGQQPGWDKWVYWLLVNFRLGLEEPTKDPKARKVRIEPEEVTIL